METHMGNRGNVTIIAAIFVAALLSVGGYKLAQTQSSNSAQAPSEPASLALYAPPLKEPDSDKDGIPDWQETLTGTDPHNPDTNGDGIPDSSPTYVEPSERDPIATSSPTLAAALSERLIGEYLSLKELNAYTAERGERLGTNLAHSIAQPVPFVPYEQSELIVDPNTSTTRALEYREHMKDVFDPLVDGLNEAEFVTLARFVESEDPAVLQELLETAAKYEAAAQRALTVSVPQDAADEHLAVVNALSFYATVMRVVVQYSYDPVASFTLLRTFNDAEKYVFTTFNGLGAYYSSKAQGI